MTDRLFIDMEEEKNCSKEIYNDSQDKNYPKNITSQKENTEKEDQNSNFKSKTLPQQECKQYSIINRDTNEEFKIIDYLNNAEVKAKLLKGLFEIKIPIDNVTQSKM